MKILVTKLPDKKVLKNDKAWVISSENDEQKKFQQSDTKKNA